MSTVAVEQSPLTPAVAHPDPNRLLKRIAPTVIAAIFATVYVIVSPPSLDLAAHLLRAKLFSAEGFGIWNNWWYAGHHVPGYSVLFPPIAAVLTPQIAGGIAATGTAALFEPLARHHFGERAWLGSLWFGAGTAMNLFTGRLTFAFGLLPAMGMALALQRRRPVLASALAVITALASPVAALFAAVAAAAYAVWAYAGERRLRAALPGLAAVVCSLLPVALLSIAFPEGGSEPFTLATLWPIPAIALIALFAIPREEIGLRAGVVLYALGCVAAYLVATPVGSNAARLGPLVAGPLAALLWWPRRKWLLAAVALPLLWFQWQAPIRDVRTSAGDPSVSAAFYQPLLSFLDRQHGPPFRVEIPFTRFHWEAYQVAPRFPLARGWERQLDIRYNHLFYGGALTPATYEAWLHTLAVRFVAVPDASLDFSAKREVHLIDRGLRYLHLVYRTRHWRVYSVANPTPIVRGPARLVSLGPNSVTLRAHAAGTALVRVRFTPYWALGQGSGCVAPDGEFTKVTIRHPGPVELVIRFSLGRIGSRSARCA
ncbi:MAG TPA: hypothetical protein VGI87_00615 [Solirubrobacteraceae bacterium]|jgi:hypothetical protein